MEKQQAIDYIHLRLDQDATRAEIVSVLIEQLHAPEAMVSKFVAQTEADYKKIKPQSLPVPVQPQPVTLPPWLEEMSIGSQAAENPAQLDEPQPDWMQRLAQSGVSPDSAAAVAVEPLPDWAQSTSQLEAPYAPEPAPVSPSWEEEAQAFVQTQLNYGRLHGDIADELSDRSGIPLDQAQSFVTGIAAQVQSPAPRKISNTTEAAEFVTAEYARGRPKLEIAAELATRTGESQDLTAKFVALTIAKLEKSKAQEGSSSPSKQSSIKLNDPALSKYVISELAKNRKRSDIVMAICERTGTDWSEAQRFVGHINAEQHTTINARKNRIIIPMCIGAIILGFVLTIGTTIPIIYLVTGGAEFASMVSSMGSNYLNTAPYIFGTGIALIGGGIIGLVLAVQSQME